jgi:hypothetical protein
MLLTRHLVAICGLAVVVLAGVRSTGPAAIPTAPPSSGAAGTTAGSDWPGFGRAPGRSNSSTTATGIDAGNVASLRRQQVRLDGTVDASPIYLRGGEVQSVSTPSGGDLFTAPAVLHDKTGTWLFAADNGATAAWILQSGRLEQKWRSSQAGTSPVIAGGLLYVYDPSGGLRVYQPDTGRQIANLDCGEGHWNSPIVVDGKIALPEGNANAHGTSGVLDIWRLPHVPPLDRR